MLRCIVKRGGEKPKQTVKIVQIPSDTICDNRRKLRFSSSSQHLNCSEAQGLSHQAPLMRESHGRKTNSKHWSLALLQKQPRSNNGTLSPAGISQCNPTKTRGRKGQTPISQSFVLQPRSYTLLSRYQLCRSLQEWQGATGVNTFVSGQRICPHVRIVIKNEFVSTSLHSFGSFPQK